jgi:hypothetical protein
MWGGFFDPRRLGLQVKEFRRRTEADPFVETPPVTESRAAKAVLSRWTSV